MTFSPTHLANFLACRHTLTLELEARAGKRERPTYSDPLADQLRKRGEEHERRYVSSLHAKGLIVEDLSKFKDPMGSRDAGVARTLDAMRGGADVIVQAPLGNDRWFGYADVLVKVPGTSALGGWHYEAHDTKLARETRGGAILQLCVYSELLGEMQGRRPAQFHVVTPAAVHSYRFDEVAAYYRLVGGQLISASSGSSGSYPDPVEHCGICRWWQVCDSQRRQDDHIQFVANLGRSHKRELAIQGVTTLTSLAEWQVPVDLKPTHGSRDKLVKLQDQASLQHKQRVTKELQFRLLDLQPHVAADGTPVPLRGLKRLPAPSSGDLFLDLEGDPFARNALGGEAGEGSREYLFGLGWIDDGGTFQYRGWWAFTDVDERRAFEEVMDHIEQVVGKHPDAHVYHYAPYEPSAFKRLAGRYATRAAGLDVMLRAGRLIDLYAIVRESIRAGVEGYSIKEMEQYYRFKRDIDLRQAGRERQAIEVALESGDLEAISTDIRDAVEVYNRDDVRSTWQLQLWLEARREEAIARGDDVPRPQVVEGEAPEEVGEREQRVSQLRERLLAGVSEDRMERTADEQVRYLGAYLLDWHRREQKSEWWEFYRLADLDDAALMDERKAVSSLEYVERVRVVLNKRTGRPTGSVVDRYQFAPQDCDIDENDELSLTDKESWGTVVAFGRLARTFDIKVGPDRADTRPTAAFSHRVVKTPKIEDALFTIGKNIADGSPASLALALLRVDPPPTRSVLELRDAVLAIQGPPGTGKTHRGSVLICDLVAAGKSVGVTAHSHAVIANLLRAVASEATRRGQEVPVLQVKNEEEFGAAVPVVVGGTVWHWCSEKASPIDVLFVDEAGQMSLANVLACTPIAGAMVLLGDPQQLDQPTKGVHPDGVGLSALEHWLGEARVMPGERGGFLGVTWRLAPSLCHFTSECFYEGKLLHKPGLERQVLRGGTRFTGAGLRVVPVEHDGNRNASDEEVAEVVRIVDELLAPCSKWVNEKGEAHQLTSNDILVVAPYNAQVIRLQDALERFGAAGLQPRGKFRVGTVDKFQGQEAPVVIYSMTTSRPEDAPRGLGFLYSLNRFNVATSRAR
ncbi:MAG: TM0106 family RecB-like putative nuclease, partial [Vicinamibacterales bacterium]